MRDGALTEVASEGICLRRFVEADEGRVANTTEGVVQDLDAHFAMVRGQREGCVRWFGGKWLVSGRADIGRGISPSHCPSAVIHGLPLWRTPAHPQHIVMLLGIHE